MTHALRRLGAAAAAASAVVLIGALPSAAHVTVNSPGATQGGYAKVTFRVPTEKGSATTKLQVVFPQDTPLAAARIKPHAGWTYVIAKRKPAKPLTDHDGNAIDSVVDSITWTAAGDGIKPDEFDEFDISLGPLPQAESLTFKALQTYADGDVVRWIETPAGAGDEPEHPAPTLALAPATEDGGTAGTPSVTPAPVSAHTAETADASGSDSPSGVAWAALGLSVVAVALAGVAVATGRRRQPTP